MAVALTPVSSERSDVESGFEFLSTGKNEIQHLLYQQRVNNLT